MAQAGSNDGADAINAALYLREGDCLNAAISAAAIVPAVGSAATAARWADRARDGARAADNISDAVRGANHADEVADAARAGTRYGDEVAVGTGRQADEVMGAACSFSEDTLVTTDSGFVPIGELDVGEMVLAWDQALDSTDFYTVTAVWAHLDTTLVTLTIDGEEIETTPEHPFYIADNAWVAAGELWLGARVKKADGGYGTVSAISVVDSPQVMYNLTVEAAHTYHVGEDGWLVHNACKRRKRRGKGRQVDRFERYGSEKEAKDTLQEGGLVQKPKPHHNNPKWIGDPGTVNPRTLGKTKNYTHKMEFETKAGTRDWVKQFEKKPRVEPNRYAIPPNQIDEFNKRVLDVVITKIR